MFNFAGLNPSWSRLNDNLVTHFEVHRRLYVHPDRPLLRLDAEPITYDPGYVVGYRHKAVAKAAWRGCDPKRLQAWIACSSVRARPRRCPATSGRRPFGFTANINGA